MATATLTPQQAVNAWNLRHPVGTEVDLLNADLSGPGLRTSTWGPARLLCGTIAVIWVQPYRAAVALDRVQAAGSAEDGVA